MNNSIISGQYIPLAICFLAFNSASVFQIVFRLFPPAVNFAHCNCSPPGPGAAAGLAGTTEPLVCPRVYSNSRLWPSVVEWLGIVSDHLSWNIITQFVISKLVLPFLPTIHVLVVAGLTLSAWSVTVEVLDWSSVVLLLVVSATSALVAS